VQVRAKFRPTSLLRPVTVQVYTEGRIIGAEQEALEPPLTPLQVQFQEPELLTALALPKEQRFAEGAETEPTPLAEPQVALIL
jgi:hypothetical protein